MRFRRRLYNLAAYLCRHLVIGLTLLGYVTAVAGVPLPVRPAKDASLPFPCQSHACGCMNASQCWDHCCCFTPGEKLAWAREHDLSPPPAPPPGADLGWRTPRPHDSPAAGEPSGPPPSSCQKCSTPGHGDQTAPPSVPEDQAGSAEVSSDHAALVWVAGIQACQCRGVGTLWVSTGAALPPPPPTAWAYDWQNAGWLRLASSVPSSLTVSPPIPPPRP